MARVNVVLDERRDIDILRWLDAQTNKSAAVREAIRMRMRMRNLPTREELRGILREELARVSVDAGDVRPQDEDAELGARLDSMF